MGAKNANYFRHPAVQHYLILFIEGRLCVLHSRDEGELLKSRAQGTGRQGFRSSRRVVEIDVTPTLYLSREGFS